MDPFLLDKDETYPYSASMYPLKSEKHLLLVEEKIDKDVRYKRFLMNELYEIKSNTLVDLVRKIMTRLFDDKLLLGYDVLGNKKSTNGKKDFLDLNICGVIFTAIVKKPQYEESCDNIERKIKAHLSQASYRIYKKLSRSSTEDNNDKFNLQSVLPKTSINTEFYNFRQTLNYTTHCSSPAVGTAPTVETTPAVEIAPVVETAPAVETSPAVKTAPVVETAPAVETTLAVEIAPAVETATSDELGLDSLSKIADLMDKELKASREANSLLQNILKRNKTAKNNYLEINQKKFNDAFDCLPLECLSDVRNMEEMLKDSKFYNFMEHKLQRFWCPDKLNKTISSILRALFDDECVTYYYNYDVKKHLKREFEELTIYRIIVDVALKLHKNETERNIKTRIRTWFRLASSRMFNKDLEFTKIKK